MSTTGHAIYMRVWLCCTLIAGCSSTANDAPRIDRIEPDLVSGRVATPAVISGQNLFARAFSSLDDQPPTLDTRWRVAIAGVVLTNETVQFRDPTTLDVTIPAGLPAGVHDIVLTSPWDRQTRLVDGLNVLDDADLVLSIEDAAGGAGTTMDQQVLLVDEIRDAYAIGRRAGTGEYLGDIPVSWSLLGQSLVLQAPDAPASNATIHARDPGISILAVSHPLYGETQTGDLIVGVCVRDEQCVDPCSTTTTCRMGTCVPGVSDKDTDMDGFVDIMCPGGDDCNDASDECGVGCFPGNPAADTCDGLDQDCDTFIDEDPEFVWFLDADGDSTGDPNISLSACVAPIGYVGDNRDCADLPGSDPACGGLDGSVCSPLEVEGPVGDPTCTDGVDNDCDTFADDLEADCCSDACSDCTGGCCRDDCGTGDCMLMCLDNACSCNLDCERTDGTCDVWCNTASTCAVDCTEVNNCTAMCSEGSTCSYDCTDTNNCDVTCDDSSICDIKCPGANNCDGIRCESGAECIVDCTGAINCSFDACTGAQMSCPGNIIVCNRPCP